MDFILREPISRFILPWRNPFNSGLNFSNITAIVAPQKPLPPSPQSPHAPVATACYLRKSQRQRGETRGAGTSCTAESKLHVRDNRLHNRLDIPHLHLPLEEIRHATYNYISSPRLAHRANSSPPQLAPQHKIYHISKVQA